MNNDQVEPSDELLREKITECKTPKIDSEIERSEEKIIKPEDKRGINLYAYPVDTSNVIFS